MFKNTSRVAGGIGIEVAHDPQGIGRDGKDVNGVTIRPVVCVWEQTGLRREKVGPRRFLQVPRNGSEQPCAMDEA